jgi:hypothetical protein
MQWCFLGGSSSNLPLIDGFDMWKALSEDINESPRNLMLHNIDETRRIASVRVGDWKLVKGKQFFFLAASTECSAGSNDHFVVGGAAAAAAVPSLVQFDGRPLK